MLVRDLRFPAPQNNAQLLVRGCADVIGAIMRFLPTFDLVALQHSCRLLSDREGNEQISEEAVNRYFGCATAAHLTNLSFPTRFTPSCVLRTPVPEKWSAGEGEKTTVKIIRSLIHTLSSIFQKLPLFPTTLTTPQALFSYYRARFSPNIEQACHAFITTGDPTELLACIPDKVSMPGHATPITSVDKDELSSQLKLLHAFFKKLDPTHFKTVLSGFFAGTASTADVRGLLEGFDASQQDAFIKLITTVHSIYHFSKDTEIQFVLAILLLCKEGTDDTSSFEIKIRDLEIDAELKPFLSQMIPLIYTLGIDATRLLLLFLMGILSKRYTPELIPKICTIFPRSLAQLCVSRLPHDKESTPVLRDLLNLLTTEDAGLMPAVDQFLAQLIILLGCIESFKNAGAPNEPSYDYPLIMELQSGRLPYIKQLNAFLVALQKGGFCDRTTIEQIAAKLFKDQAVDIVPNDTDETRQEAAALRRLISLGHQSMATAEFIRVTLGSQPFDQALRMIQDRMRATPLSDQDVKLLFRAMRLDARWLPLYPKQSFRALFNALSRLSPEQREQLTSVVLGSPGITRDFLENLNTNRLTEEVECQFVTPRTSRFSTLMRALEGSLRHLRIRFDALLPPLPLISVQNRELIMAVFVVMVAHLMSYLFLPHE